MCLAGAARGRRDRRGGEAHGAVEEGEECSRKERRRGRREEKRWTDDMWAPQKLVDIEDEI